MIGKIISFLFSEKKILVWVFLFGIITCSIVLANEKPKNENIKDDLKSIRKNNYFGVDIGYIENHDNIYECDKEKEFINMIDYYNLIKTLLVIFTCGFVFSSFITFTYPGKILLMFLKEIGIENVIFSLILLILIFLLLLQTSQKPVISTLIMFIILIGVMYYSLPIEIRQIGIMILSFGLVITGIILEIKYQKKEKNKESFTSNSFIGPPLGPCYQTNGKFGQIYYKNGENYCVGEDGTYQSQKEINKINKKKEEDKKLAQDTKKGDLTNEEKKKIKDNSKYGNPFGFGVCLLDSGLFGVLMPYFGNKCVPFDEAMAYIKGLTDKEKKDLGLLDGKKIKDDKLKNLNKKIKPQPEDCHPREFNFEQECNEKYHNPEVGLKEITGKNCITGFYQGICELGYHNGIKLPKGDLSNCYPNGTNFNGVCKKEFGGKPNNKSTNWGYEYLLEGANGGCAPNYSRALCSQLYQSGENILGNVSNCVSNWEDNTAACQKTAYNKCMENVDQFEGELSEVEMELFCRKKMREVEAVGENYNSCIPPFKRAECKNKMA